MRSLLQFFCALGVIAIALAACGSKGLSNRPFSPTCGVSLDPEAEGHVRHLAPVSPTPRPDPTNRVADDPRAAILGQAFFFERSYAGPLLRDSHLGKTGQPERISCASCHEGPGLDDLHSVPRSTSVGTDQLPRNAPSLINASDYAWVAWGGRHLAQWELPLSLSENPRCMNGSRLRIAQMISYRYRAAYESVFGPINIGVGTDPIRFPEFGRPKDPNAPDGPWESMRPEDQDLINDMFVNFGKAIAAYLRRLRGSGAAFDRFIAGDSEAIDCAAQRGLIVFTGKAGCARCHGGPQLTDNGFHNHGLGTPDGFPVDEGRALDTRSQLAFPFNTGSRWSDAPNTDRARLAALATTDPADLKGRFRTPSLRNVALTAPYMHAGQFATLQDVVTFYNGGHNAQTRDPLGLSARDQADLVHFLESLTAQPLPEALLRNPVTR